MIEVFKSIWLKRKIIYKFIFASILIGIIVAFGTKEEYESWSKVLPESEDGARNNLSRLGGLAGLAGINLNFGNNNALTPEVYPQIIQSIPFQLRILNEKITFEKYDTLVSSYTFFKQIDKPSIIGRIFRLPLRLKSLFKKDIKNPNNISIDSIGIIKLSKEDFELIKEFRDRVVISVEPETGLITVKAIMPDPVAAAELSDKCINLLQDFIINYKITKAKENLAFIHARFEDAKKEYEKAQSALATFNDRNQNVVTSRAQSEFQRLQNEYNLTFEVYKELATQLEQSKIKVKEDTPVFTIVEPARVPNLRFKPERKLILAIAFFTGIVLSILYILGLNYLKNNTLQKKKSVAAN